MTVTELIKALKRVEIDGGSWDVRVNIRSENGIKGTCDTRNTDRVTGVSVTGRGLVLEVEK